MVKLFFKNALEIPQQQLPLVAVSKKVLAVFFYATKVMENYAFTVIAHILLKKTIEKLRTHLNLKSQTFKLQNT